MRKSTQHLSGLLVITLFALAVIGTGKKPPVTVATPPTMKTGTFTLKPLADEIFTKQTIARMLQANAHPSIVLRVPTPGAKVTEEEKQYNVSIYNTIEKEFAKAGYVVRDRALFAKVLEQEVLDYSKIGSVTETDLILELISFMRPDYTTREYVDELGVRSTAPRDIVFSGVQLEFKLISVKENDMVGAYTFHYAPCVPGCKQTFNADQKELLKVPSEVPMDFFREAAARLILELAPGR
jgi:hypothetical protein